MKRVVNVLTILSVISLALMLIIYIPTINSDMRTRFIVDWFLVPLGFLAAPLLGRTLSLAYNKDYILPKTWLIIYSGLIVALAFSLGIGFMNQTRDLPIAIRGDFSSVKGEAHAQHSSRVNQSFIVERQEFSLRKRHFNDIHSGYIYNVIFLPNSNYIIDIIDENGQSLYKR